MKYGLVTAGAIAVIIAGAGAAYMLSRADRGDDRLAECPPGQVSGADIGGSFTLVDSNGQIVTDKDVLTRPSLVYFGYTFCPDVCPMDMSRNADAVEALKEQSHDVGLVFITIDPARDTPEVVGEFVHNIHPGAIGLTGSEEQIAAAVKAYRVFRQINDDDPDYYTVDHSAFTYLMLPDRGFVSFYSHDAKAGDVAKSVSCVLNAIS